MAVAFRHLDLIWRVALGVLLGLIALGVIWTVVWGGLLALSTGHQVCGEGARHVSCSGGHYAKPIPAHTMPVVRPSTPPPPK